MIQFLLCSLLLASAYSQNFEEELSTILKPPPLPTAIQKNDFTPIEFLPDQTPFIPSSQIITQQSQNIIQPAPSNLIQQAPSNLIQQVPSTLIQQAPNNVIQQTPNVIPQQLAHHAVLFNAEQESKLPPNLINPFYKDARIANALAKQSWFTPGEKHVTDRETEKIPRDRIYYALKSAGLIRRRRSAVVPGSLFF